MLLQTQRHAIAAISRRFRFRRRIIGRRGRVHLINRQSSKDDHQCLVTNKITLLNMTTLRKHQTKRTTLHEAHRLKQRSDCRLRHRAAWWSASNIAQGSASSSSGAHLDRSQNRTRRDAVNVFKQLRVSAAHAIVQLQATSAAQTTNKIVARSR